ncbi:MAG: hypothetical protein AB7K86_08475 [Rhodospirillales bacterium]
MMRSSVLVTAMAALLAALASGCATPEQAAANDAAIASRIDEAMNAQFRCGFASLPQVDDGISDAQSVALALSMSCGNEYQAATEAFAAKLENDRQRAMFSERRERAGTRIENFLPIVMRYRATVRKPAK